MKGQTSKTLKQINSSFKEISNELQIYNEKLAQTCCFKKKKMYVFIGCIGSLSLLVGFFQLWRVGATLSATGVQADCGGFSSCGAQALGVWTSLLTAWWVPGLGLTAVAHGLSCSCSMQDLPVAGIRPTALSLKGRFLTTGPPGKPLYYCLI